MCILYGGRFDDTDGPSDEDDDIVEVVVVIDPPDPDGIGRTGIRQGRRRREHDGQGEEG